MITVRGTAILICMAGLLFSGCTAGFRYPGPGKVFESGNSARQLLNANNTANIAEKVVSSPLNIQWKYKAKGVIKADIAANEYFTVAGDLTGNLYLISSTNGAKFSRKRFKGAFSAPPLVVDTMLFFATDRDHDGIIGAINLKNGKTVWEKKYGSVESPLCYRQGIVIAGNESGQITALHAENGDLFWKHELKDPISAGCYCRENEVFAGSIGGKLCALDFATGKPLWNIDLSAAIMSLLPASDSALFCAGLDSNVYKISAQDGRKIWNFKTGGGIRAGLTINDGILYVCSTDGKLYAINSANAELVFSFDTGAPIIAAPLVIPGHVVVGSMNGVLYVIDALSGDKKASYDAKSPIITSPEIAGDNIEFCCRDRRILCIR